MDEHIGAVGQPKGVSVIGYSVTANIDGQRQMVFQHFVAQDATDEEVNRDLDRIMRLVDRQRAIYELPDMRDELEKLSDEIAQYTEDKTTSAEANFRKAQAEIDVQLETMQADEKRVREEAYDAFRKSGRQGQFEPKGHVKAQLERLAVGIREAINAKAKNESERDFYVQNIDGNIQRRRERIALLQEKIAAREKVAT
jgi:Zn-dependent oligopeptidase